MKRFLLFGIIAIVSLVLDQLTKIWAADRIGHSCPKLERTGAAAPEVGKCNDLAPTLRLSSPLDTLEVSATNAGTYKLVCDAGALCLKGDIRLGTTPPGARATGEPAKLKRGSVVTVRGRAGSNEGVLRYAYEKGGPPLVLIEGYLAFEYAENEGAAFSFLRDQPGIREPVLITIAILAIGLLLWWVRRITPEQKLLAVSLGLLLSGALGNLIDRIRLGYVIDFILFHIRDSFRWPNFNVADIAIVVGVGLLAWDSIRAWLRERREAKLAKAKKGAKGA